MADLKDDDKLEDNEDEKKDKYNDKFECYNYDDNTMHTMYLKNSKWEQVKIDKVQDYYELFVRILKTEDKKLQTHEHFWVLGIDEAGYSACLYVVIVGYPNFFNVAPSRLFKTALHHDSVKIIIAQSRPDAETLSVTPTDIELTNAVYHKAEILELQLVDHIIISNSSINSKKPLYCSHLEQGVVYFVQNDMTYKSYKDIEPEIEKARNEFGADKFIEGKQEGELVGASKEKVNMAKKMLLKNKPIEEIIEFTELTIEEIEKIHTDRCTE